VVDLSGSGTRSGTGGGNTATTVGAGGTTTTSSSGNNSSSYHVSIGASWEPDLFGRIRRTIDNASATERG
jgi:outer membrane protein TolC